MDAVRKLSPEEASLVRGGEALTLSLVLTYLAVSVLTVIVWKLYTANKGKISLPGGALFQWESACLPLAGGNFIF